MSSNADEGARANTSFVVSGKTIELTLIDASEMATALAGVVRGPDLAARSGAPAPLADSLPQTLGDAWIAESGDIRAGSWLLVVDEYGLHWEHRVARPDAPRIGLLFVAPVENSEGKWRVPSISFQRVR